MEENKEENKKDQKNDQNPDPEKTKEENIKQRNNTIYYGIRMVQMLCIGVFIFGLLWEGTEKFNLSTPEFMMIYGGVGSVISEIIARLFKKKILK